MSDIVKCIIVDDEPLAIELIKKHIEQIPILELVGTFQNPLKAFGLLKQNTVDLVFLDIHMPVLTGIDFVKSLQLSQGVIFTTAYRKYAVESYELSVIDYLIKPITFERFFMAVNKFLDQQKPLNRSSDANEKNHTLNNYIYVNANKKYIKIEFDQILYIDSIKDYIRIHTREENIVTKDKISNFETKLPKKFLRVHRSFIVNTNKITAYNARDIEIDDNEIPIGKTFKNEVIKRLRM